MKRREIKMKIRLCFSHKIFGIEKKMESAVRIIVIRLKWG